MSTNVIQDYIEEVEKNLNNKHHRAYSEALYEHYQKNIENADSFFKRPNLLKDRVVFSKFKSINKLDKYLIDFEFLFTRRGGKIIWASDKDEATKEILKLLKEKGIKKVVKANSKAVDEIELTKALKESGAEVRETEFNAFYNQLKNDDTDSIDYPILNTSFEQASKRIQKELNFQEKNIEGTIDFIKKYLINQCSQTRVGITGANFLISDIGGVVICEDQGNIVMNTSFPEIHIVVAGIEKMIPSLLDLEKFLHVLSVNSTGNMLPWNTQIITGPRQDNETDGPKEMYLVLIDNKRTEVIKQAKQRSIFHCIRCGACNSVCPIYKLIGNKPYGGAYVGPVGAVVNPFMLDFYNAAHQSYACTLCKRCTEVCPMNISIHELILQNRKESVQREFYVSLDKSMMRQLRKMMMKRSNMDAAYQNFIIKMNYKKLVGNQRIFPDLGIRSFNVRYKEKNNIK